MLEAIRNRSKGPVAKIVLGLIIVPFAFTGVYSYFNAGGANVVATVNDSEIDIREFEQAYRMQQQRLGDNFDLLYNSEEMIQIFRSNVLQQLINQRLSAQAIDNMGVRVSDEVLKKEIVGTPGFQDENGNFDHDRYQLLVESAGYSVAMYQSLRKTEMASQQFTRALSNSNFALDYELLKHQGLEAQTRDIDYLVISKQRFMESMDFTTEEAQQEVSDYYNSNLDRFRVPEKVAVEYVLISKADFLNSIAVTDDEIANYYEDNLDAYEGTERRRVAHILVTVPIDAAEADVLAAQTKIDQAKAAISAGEAFESVVTKYSDDTLSAEEGGDLDWIEREMMDAAFEEAAFALTEIGSVTDVVRSEFGFHLIKLLDTENAAAKPLAEVKDKILADLKSERAEDAYLEAKDLLAERAFEYSDSLNEASEAVTKEVQTSGLFDPQFGIGLPQDLRSERSFITAAFSDEVLLDELNSELIDLSNDRAVVLRKLNYQEEGIRPLAEVKTGIQDFLISDKASQKTSELATKMVSQLNEGSSLDLVKIGLGFSLDDLQWTKQNGLSRAGTEVNATVREFAFGMDVDSEIKTVELPNGDMAVVKLNTINRPAQDANVAATHSDKFIQFHTQTEFAGFLKYLDENASISRNMTNAEIVQ